MATALERVTVRTRSQALGPLQALPSKGLALSFKLRRVFRGTTLVLYITHAEVCGCTVKAPFKYGFHVQNCSCRDTNPCSKRLLCTLFGLKSLFRVCLGVKLREL